MTYKTGAAFRQALETRLRDRTLRSGLPLIRLRKIVAFDRLLARISKQSRSRWVLKGGLALEWHFGDRARTTMDIDATVVQQSSVDELLAELRKAAAENIGDWFEFEVAVHGELLICPQFREFSVSCYDAEMRDLLILFIHFITTLTRLASPGGVRSVLAESLLVKHQLLIFNRSRRRAPNLRLSDRIVAGWCTLFLRPSRLIRSAIVL
ncbi:MAG TPA: nucleotidyl transferase AbiEii/AbiGii toxin family protein, partial [Terriglobia bacterium]